MERLIEGVLDNEMGMRSRCSPCHGEQRKIFTVSSSPGEHDKFSPKKKYAPPMTALVDTKDGRAWLEQFDPADRDVARTLLGSLTLISHTTFRTKIRELLESIAVAPEEPIALYAVREVDNKLPYFINKQNRPSPVQPGKKVGSEGEIATLITGLERLRPTTYLNHPPLQTLRNKRCHHIALVDDLCGSGDQAAKFIKNFYQHKTIKSWCSSKLLNFHIVAFAISEEAETKIATALHLPNRRHAAAEISFNYCYRPTPGNHVWPRDLRNQVIRLCRDYGKRSLAKWQHLLGYNNTMATIVFAHGCPNNTPAILWHPSPQWTPIFPGRAVPLQLLPAFDDADMLTGLSMRLRALHSAGPEIYEPMSPTGLNLMLVLAALKRKIRRLDRISQATGLPVPTCRQAIDECKLLGFLDTSEHLTNLGTNHLQHAGRSGSIPDVTPPLKNDFYFPKSLRAIRETG